LGIPLYVRLSSISNPFENLVEKIFKEFIKSITVQESERLLTSQIILILDGYDEIFGTQNLYTSN
jgi:hypothetical protein